MMTLIMMAEGGGADGCDPDVVVPLILCHGLEGVGVAPPVVPLAVPGLGLLLPK